MEVILIERSRESEDRSFSNENLEQKELIAI